MKNKIKILIAAGGTGGHLFPAIAVCEQIQDLTKNNCEFHFIGNADKIEGRVVPSLGYNFHPIKISGIKKSLSVLLLPFQLTKSISISRKLIADFSIDAVLATGAYLSFPPGFAAHLTKKPLFLMESNVNPGKAIKMLAQYATKIFTSFDESINFFDKKVHHKIITTGNPIRKQFLNFPDKNSARKQLGIPFDKKVIFIFGGSLGALSINKAIERNLDYFLKNDYFIIWQTGKNYNPPVSNHKSLIVKEFIDDIAIYYAAADLIICRSGATTVAELSIAAKPSILVPLPSASNNEQYHNAKALEKYNAATIIPNEQISDKLVPIVSDIFQNGKLDAMAKSAAKLARPDAAYNVANEILKTINFEF